MGIDPKIWGSKYWFVIYTTAFTYPNKPSSQEKKDTKNFLILLGKKLPCEECNNNFKKHLKKFPLNNKTLKNKISLINWVINVNNEVRKSTGKEPLKYKEIKEYYEKQYNYSSSNFMNNFYICVITAVILLLLLTLIIKIL